MYSVQTVQLIHSGVCGLLDGPRQHTQHVTVAATEVSDDGRQCRTNCSDAVTAAAASTVATAAKTGNLIRRMSADVADP